MHFHQICKLHILIYGGHAREAHGFKLCCCFSLPVDVCIDVTFILAYVTIGSYISCVSTNYTFATVYKGRHTKEKTVIDEPAHVAVGLQLLETSSITTFAQGTFFKEPFLRKILAILPICDNEKNHYANCVYTESFRFLEFV